MADEYDPLDAWARPPLRKGNSRPFPVMLTLLGTAAVALLTVVLMRGDIVPLRWVFLLGSLSILAPILAATGWGWHWLWTTFALFLPPIYHLVFGPRRATLIRIHLAVCVTGIVLAFITSFFISLESEDRLPIPSPYYGFVPAAMLGGFALAVRLKDDSDWRPIFRPLAIALSAGTCAGIGFWSLLAIGTVEDAARIAAAGRPYCIVDSDYLEVRSRFALNPLSLRSGPEAHGWTLRFHAVLIAGSGDGQEFYNWSSTAMRFDPLPRERWELIGGRASSQLCSPRANFVDTLPPIG